MNKIQEAIFKELDVKPGEVFTYNGYQKIRLSFDYKDELQIEYYDYCYNEWFVGRYVDFDEIINHPELAEKVGFDENE